MKLRVVGVGVGAGVGGCLLSWAVGATRTAAVVGGTLTSTAADLGRPAGRAPAATTRRSTGVRAGVRLDAVGVTGCACSRCEIAAAVQTPARTRRTSNRDAAGGGRRPARRVLMPSGPRWAWWRSLRLAGGGVHGGRDRHLEGCPYHPSITNPASRSISLVSPFHARRYDGAWPKVPLRGSRGPPGAAPVSGVSLSTRSACGAVVNTTFQP